MLGRCAHRRGRAAARGAPPLRPLGRHAA